MSIISQMVYYSLVLVAIGFASSVLLKIAGIVSYEKHYSIASKDMLGGAVLLLVICIAVYVVV